jgi:hypothetical protein
MIRKSQEKRAMRVHKQVEQDAENGSKRRAAIKVLWHGAAGPA